MRFWRWLFGNKMPVSQLCHDTRFSILGDFRRHPAPPNAGVETEPLGPLGFEGAQHRQTLRPSRRRDPQQSPASFRIAVKDLTRGPPKPYTLNSTTYTGLAWGRGPRSVAAGLAALRKDAGLCCGSRLLEERSVCLCWAPSKPKGPKCADTRSPLIGPYIM